MKKVLGITIIFFAFLYVINGRYESKSMQEKVAQKVLRFHVLANSDSEDDQALKLQVRDSVGTYIEQILKESKSLEESKDIIENNMEDILSIAKQTIVDKGYDYEVSGRITETDFPEKSYGDFDFPAGRYEALQIIIGKGKGHNWWCVLYPNLCFEGAVYDVTDEDAKEQMREVLTSEEYEYVFNSGKYEIKWKFVEWIEQLIGKNK